jgi:hypothetical protein
MSEAASTRIEPASNTREPSPLLAWLGFMSLVLALWVYRAHEPRSWTPIVLLGIAAVEAIGASLAALSSDRRGLAALLVGALHGLAALALLMQWGMTAAGEWISGLVFALACGGMGLRAVFTRQTQDEPQDEPTPALESQRGTWMMAALVLAIVCGIGVGTLLYSQRTMSTVALPDEEAPLAKGAKGEEKAKGPTTIWDWKYGPETAGVALLAILFAAAGIWLSQTTLTPASSRMLRVTVGGSLGLIAFLALLLRAVVWRNELFAFGTDAAGAWKFWVWSYALLGSLGLMFLSLASARRDVREQVGLRRLVFGYDAIFRGLLVFALLMLVNVLIHYALPFNYNWSKARGLQALSPASTNLLATLKKPVHVFALLPRNYSVYGEVLHLLENAAGANTAFRYEIVDPDVDKAAYEQLQQRFKVLQPNEDDPRAAGGRGLLIAYGDMPANPDQAPPHAFIAERKLYDQQRDSIAFKGESELMKELNSLVQSKEKRKLYILQGHDELDVRAPELALRRDPRQPMQPLGAATLVEQLQKENYEVRGLFLDKEVVADKEGKIVVGPLNANQERDVPADASVVIIPGPSSPIPKTTLDALQRYMDRGGRMLIHFEVVADASMNSLRKTGLEDWLKRYNVDVTDDYILNAEPIGDDLTLTPLLPPAKSELKLAQQFAIRPLIARTVRVIRPIEQAGAFKAETFLQCDVRPTRPWIESTVAGLRSPIRFAQELNAKEQLLPRLSPKAVPAAVVVTEGKDDAAKPRLAVFGDAEMMSNVMLTRDRQETLLDLEVATLAWLADTGGYVGPRPIETGFYKAKPNAPYGLMLGGSTWVILLSIFSLGMALWMVRRR